MADPLDPISWIALLSVQERLLQVSVDNGYRSDIGLGLVTLDPSEEVSDPTTIHTLVTGETITDNDDASGRKMTVSDMDARIEVAVPFEVGDNPARIVHRAIADVRKSLRDGAWRAPAGIRSITVTSSSLVTAPNGVAAVIAQVNLRVGLAESTTPAP